MLSDEDLLSISSSGDLAALTALSEPELDRLKQLASKALRATAPQAAIRQIELLSNEDPKVKLAAAQDVLDRSGLAKKPAESEPVIQLQFPAPIAELIASSFAKLLMRNVTPEPNILKLEPDGLPAGVVTHEQ